MRKLLLAAVLISAGALVFFSGDTPPGPVLLPGETAGLSSADGAARALRTPAPRSSSGTARVQHRPRAVPEDVAPAQTGSTSESPQGPLLHGEVIVRRADGSMDPDVYGQLYLTFEPDYIQVAVPVRGGAFETDREASSFDFSNGLVATDRVALRTDFELECKPGADGFISIEFAWCHEAVLHVLDADSDAPLSGVEVWLGFLGEAPSELHESRRVLHDGTSPVVIPLDPRRWTRPEGDYWVRAQGTVWEEVKIDHGRAVEHTVRLEAAGSAALRVQGDCRDPRVEVCLLRFAQDGSVADLCAGEPPVNGAQQVTGPLRVGRWEALLRLRSPTGEEQLLDRAPFEVRAGRETLVGLVYIPPSKAPPRVPLSGTLCVDPGWKLERPQFEIEPREIQEWPHWCDRGDPHALRLDALDGLQSEEGAQWSAGNVRPGEYDLTLFDGYVTELASWEVVVGLQGESNLSLDVRAPQRLEVYARDALSAEPIDPGEVSVSRHVALGVVTRPPGEADPESGARVVWLAPGAHRLQVAGAGYVGQLHEVSLGAGDSRLDVELARQAQIVLTLMDADRPLNLTFSVMNSAEVSPVEDDDVVYTLSADFERSGVLSCVLDEPGAYEVRLPRLAGYERVEPFTIELAAGERVERTIPMQSEN